MASYLFKDSDKAMAEWKSEARERGWTFAELIRVALAAECATPGMGKLVREAREAIAQDAATALTSQPMARARQARSAMCVHRVAAGAYCSRCD